MKDKGKEGEEKEKLKIIYNVCNNVNNDNGQVSFTFISSNMTDCRYAFVHMHACMHIFACVSVCVCMQRRFFHAMYWTGINWRVQEVSNDIVSLEIK